MMSNSEALYNGVVIVCTMGIFLGWMMVWFGLFADPGDSDGSVPRDASWLDQAPPWLVMITAGVVVLLLFHLVQAAAKATLRGM